MANNYWEERALKIKANELINSRRYETQFKERMSGVEDDINKLIERYTVKFANANDVSLVEAQRMLSRDEIQNWHHSLTEWENMAVSPEYEYLYRKKMDSEYSRSQITRLQALDLEIKQLMMQYADDERPKFEKALQDVYKDTYYRSTYNVQDMQGTYTIDFQKFNEQVLKSVIAQNWQGSDFSSRLWGNLVDTLPSYLEQAISRGVTLGYGPDKMVREAKTVFKNFSDRDIHRLIVTEMGHVDETATEQSYKDNDLKKYQYMATLEKRTCEVCGGLDQKVFNVKNIERGTNYPLVHPHCRCTTAPWIPEVDQIKGKRWSKNPFNGGRELVDKMSYNEWREWVRRSEDNKILDSVTPDGVKITRVSEHALDRMVERGNNASHVVDAIQNPLKVKDKKPDSLGRQSRRYIGEFGTAVVNPETGVLATVYPTSSSRAKKYKKERDDDND